MYEQHFGLTRRPFENTPNPEFFFASRQHREALAALSYGVEACKGFMLLTGDVGAGKTFVLKSLKHELREKNPIFLEVTTPWITAEELFAELPKQLGMTGDTRWSSIDFQSELKDKLISLYKEDRRVVVLLDEAQQLPERTLEGVRLLSNYETENAKLIQIIFVGQNELHETLGKYSLRQVQQRITLSRSLHYLSELETRRYIRHRLLVSGSNDEIFTESALTLIYRASLGSPRLINLICDNCLITAFAQKIKEIGPDVVRDVVDDLPIANALPKQRSTQKEEETVAAPAQVSPTPVKVAEPASAKVPARTSSVKAELNPQPAVTPKEVKVAKQVPANNPKPKPQEDIRTKHKYFDDERLNADKSLGSITQDEGGQKRSGLGGFAWLGLLLLLPIAWGAAKWYEKKEIEERSQAALEEREQRAIQEQAFLDAGLLPPPEPESTEPQMSLFDQMRSEVDAAIVRDIDSVKSEEPFEVAAVGEMEAEAPVTDMGLVLDRLDQTVPELEVVSPSSTETVSEPVALSPVVPSKPKQEVSSERMAVSPSSPALPGFWVGQGSEAVLVEENKRKSYSLSRLVKMTSAPELPVAKLRASLRSRTVRQGETLSQVARETYGTWNDTVKDIVREVNPSISKRMDRLLREDQVNLPALNEADLIVLHEGLYYIYAGTLSSGVKAMGLADALKPYDVNLNIQIKVVDNRNNYRLYIGAFSSKQEADRVLSNMSFRHMPFLIK